MEFDNEDLEEQVSTLDKVHKYLPMGSEIDPEILDRIRQALRNYLGIKDDASKGKKGFSHAAKQIFDRFTDARDSGYNRFKLTISDDTINRFANNYIYKNKSGKAKGNNKSKNSDSFRLIAAFLLHPEEALLTENDIASEFFGYREAHSVTKFLESFGTTGDELSVRMFSGVYSHSEKTQGGGIKSLSLRLTPSSDGSHIVAEEHVVASVVGGAITNSIPRKSLGWGVITALDMVHIYLKFVDDGVSHFCQSLGHNTIIHNGAEVVSKLYVLKLIMPCDLENSLDKDSVEDSLMDYTEQNLHFLIKDANVLTFPLPSDDKKKWVGINPFGDTTRSAVLKESSAIMTEIDKIELGKQAIKAYQRFDLDKILELVDQGASINYQDPRSGNTLIHYIAYSGHVEMYEQLISRAHDEYDFLLRDTKGRLASNGALTPANNEPELFDIIREKEIEAGKSLGIFPSNIAPHLDDPIEISAPPPPEI